MKKLQFKILLITINLIIIISCSKKDTPQPTPTVIFHDDFNDNSLNYWKLANNDTIYSEILDGKLYFANKNLYEGYSIWQYIVIDESKNFSIKTSVSYVSGTSNYGYGLTWGIDETSGNLYQFAISKNGLFYVGKVQNGKYISLKSWTVFSGINANKPNELEVRKESNNLIFKINGSQVFKISSNQPFFGNGIGFVSNNNVKMEIDYLDITQW